MQYHLSCPICLKEDFQQFIVDLPPNNDGVYEVTCPKGHIFKTDILSHHFQTLFENAIHSLSNKYFIESFVSFAACYERFIEYFLNIVLISRGVKISSFEEAWKNIAKQSERQLGAFIFIYLQEFGVKPQLLSNSNIQLRNNVIHKGYLPTKKDCMKFGEGVLGFIRPVVELLKTESDFDLELTKSVNYTGIFDDREIHQHYMPYQLFAINRPINETDKKTISDFLNS
ncbi:MAG: hypothetical protein R3E32_04370 [Chitinophagales bacterium]